MDKKLTDGMTRQITAEFYSGYLYLQMAAWFEEHNLKGFAHWMRVQSQEETCHGLILFNYLAEAGVRITLGKIDAPGSGFKSAQDIFNTALKHEKSVTASINALVDLAIEEKDHATRLVLEWFVAEQVEEEASASEILEKIKVVGDSASPALLVLDAALAARAFTMPAPLAGKWI